MADYTHKDLAKALGVTETTIKSYRRKFGPFYAIASRGKPLRFEPSALDVSRRIKTLFKKGLDQEEVRKRLAEEFPVVAPEALRPAPEASPDPTPLAATVVQLAGRVEKLTERLAATVEAGQRREEALLQEIRGLREALGHGAAPAPRPKRVRVTNAYGEAQDYLIDEGPGPQLAPQGPWPEKTAAPQPSAPHKTTLKKPGPENSGPENSGPENSGPEKPGREKTPPQQEPRFMDLPLVVRNEGGEFLGVGGRSAGGFSLRDFVDLIAARPRWSALGNEVWNLEAEAEAARPDPSLPGHYKLRLEPTRTPRGNEVALITRLMADGRAVPPAYLYTYIKTLRSAD